MRILTLLFAFTCLSLLLGAAADSSETDCGYAAMARQAQSAGAQSRSAAPGDLAPEALEYVAPSKPFTISHVSLDLDLDLKAQTIRGSVTHSLECLRDGTTELRLDAVGLQIDGVSIDGAPAAFKYPVRSEQSSSPDAIWGIQPALSSDAQIAVFPAQPLMRGQQLSLRVDYHGAPREGLYWMAPDGVPGSRYEVWSQGEGENNRYWVPCFDFPSEKATYDGTFRVDKGFSVLSNGLLTKVDELPDGRTQFRWGLTQPQASYLIMVAAAPYEIHTVDWRGRQVQYWVPPGTGDATVQRVFGETPDMLEFYSNVTGIDYPFDKYAQVVVQNFIFGGMENTTATVMNDRILFDERAQLTRDSQGLIAHELAHMWWGDMVTCREWSQLWLNEGFATYFQLLYEQHSKGDDEFIYDLAGNHAATIGADGDPRPVVVDFYNRRDAQSSSNIYVKGASVLQMLRHYLGDAVFFDAIHRYGARMQYQNAETSDLMRAFREASGENLDWFFEQWIYLAGHPDLKVDKSWDGGRKMLTLHIAQTQKTGGLVPLFRLPLDIEVTTAEGAKLYRILVTKADQEFSFELPGEPLMVLVDKGGNTLMTLDFPRSVDELAYQLAHADTWGRIEAARALGGLQYNDAAAKALADGLAAPGFWGLRRECALALAKTKHGSAAAALTAALADPEARVRLAAAEALGSLPVDTGAEAKLLALLDGDAAYQVREQAVASLVAVKSEHAYAACLDALGQESDLDRVRAAGLRGLRDLSNNDDSAKDGGKPQPPQDELGTVRKLAAPGNSRRYRHEAIDTYATLALKLKDDDQRKQAAEFLSSMLDDGFLRTRGSVIAALDKLGVKDSVDPLRKLAAADPVEGIRQQAADAANDIESRKTPDSQLDDIAAQLKAVRDELDSVKAQLGELEKKVPEQPVEPPSR